jgi:tRNA 2-thiocytidine biosynthesis protein TtcA
MLSQWEIEQPGRIESIFSAMQNVAPSQLSDKALFDFENLQIDRSEVRAEYEYADSQEVNKARTKSQLDPVQIIQAVSLS